jgi:subtilisin family serine protease
MWIRVAIASVLIATAGVVPSRAASSAESTRPEQSDRATSVTPAVKDPLPARSASGGAPLLGAAGTDVVPDRYIVVLSGAKTAARAAAESTATARGARVLHRYTTAVNGFSATMSADALQAVRKDPAVEYVEAVRILRGTGTQPDAPWHLDLLDQRGSSRDGAYQSPNTGAGVTVYVLDQAVRTTHSEFGGRAFRAADFVGGAITEPCMFHGTGVAALVGGATYGTAKGVRMGSVRVLNCANNTTTDIILAGVQWVIAHAQRPAVVNMSLGGDNANGAYRAIDGAIANSSVNNRLTYVVSAGNGNTNACTQSPAAVTEAITVGATTQGMQRWVRDGMNGSNWGSCLDLFAPGHNVASASQDTDQAQQVMTGTSMAAPLVAGVAATYLARNPTATAAQVHAAVVGAATSNVVGDTPGSPNNFLYANTLPQPYTTTNPGLSGMLGGYGDGAGCADWSAGDGTQSTPLPDGRRVWFFADSFLNSPAAHSSRPFDFSSVRNAMVVQSGSSFRTITGGNTCQEGNDSLPFWDRYADTSVEDPSQSSNAFYWPNEGMVVGSNIVRFYYRNIPTPDGWWTDTHTAIATIPISSLNGSALKVHPTLMAPVYSYGQHPINWGAGLLSEGGWVYIYGAGIVNSQNERRLYLARSAPADVANPAAWQFNLGSGRDAWSTPGNQGAARPVHSTLAVENGFAVATVNGATWLVQHEPNLNGGDIVAHPGSQPWNIGNRIQRLYRPPEGPRDALHKFQFYYEVRVHRGLGAADSLVFSYNVNSTAVSVGCRSRLNHDASIYRPRFLNVPLDTLYLGNADAPAVAKQTAGRDPEPTGGRLPRGLHDRRTPPSGSPLTTGGQDGVRPLAADFNWYDQWAAPQKANHGCPPLTKATAVTGTAAPDGVVTLSWDDYGRDMWYWIYSRDATLGQPFTKHELWAAGTRITQGPVTSTANNGHVFEYYVVPFAYGDPTGQNNTAPPTSVVRLTVRMERPDAPQNVRASGLAVPKQLTVQWNSVTFPSTDVYYALWYWDETAGETEVDARRISLIQPTNTSWTISDLVSDHQYAFRMNASNIAGASPPSTVGRHIVY